MSYARLAASPKAASVPVSHQANAEGEVNAAAGHEVVAGPAR
jgi:hypothetical protein